MKRIELPVLALAVALHMLPRPFGVSSVGATALYSGAYGDRRWSWLIVGIPLTLGLLVTGLYEPLVFAFVFLGFALSTLAGRLLARRQCLRRFAAAVVLGASTFYLVSNISVWLVYFPQSAAGLLECYIAGLPYLGVSILADSVYAAVLFGAHYAVRHRCAACVAT